MDVARTRARRGVLLFAWALLAVGLAARLVPLVRGTDRLLRQYPSEDGYLMLTIARNIALGKGMSTADGTIVTNGTQPAVTFLWALGARLFDGAKVATVAWALAFELAFAVGTALAVRALTRRLLAGHAQVREISWLAAAAWSAQMLSCMHGMNCLETGAYALAVVGFVHAFIGRGEDPFAPWSLRRTAALGAFLGLCAWIRIDAVFLFAAACLTRALFDRGARVRPRAAHVLAATVMGAVGVAVVSPWLLYNKIQFGSFTPISGTAQSFDSTLGKNMSQAVANAAEYALVVAPVPQPLEKHPLVNAALAGVLLAVAIVVLRAFARGTPRLRAGILVAGGFALGLFGYYGAVFGAPHFVGRYLFPLSPFLAIVWSALFVAVLSRLPALTRPLPRAAWTVGLIALLAWPNVRLYTKRPLHAHFQVVEWVEANVPDATWVGAIQTGTLGYFHDRTLNLDGKVNPEALRAVLERKIPEYVVERRLPYLADWREFVEIWPREFPAIARHYAVLVDDPARNLGVLAWREEGAPTR